MTAKRAKRTRLHIVYYGTGGARIEWQTKPDVSMTREQLIAKLRDIADVLEGSGKVASLADSLQEQVVALRKVVRCSAMASKLCPEVFDREDWCDECNALALSDSPVSQRGADQ